MEDALLHYARSMTAEDKQNELKKVIRSLNAIIEKQERDLVAVERERDNMRNSEAWVNKWATITEAEAMKESLTDKLTMQRHYTEFAMADKESTEFNIALRCAKIANDTKAKEAQLREELREARSRAEDERSQRLAVIDQLAALSAQHRDHVKVSSTQIAQLQQTLRSKQEEVDKLTITNSEHVHKIAELECQFQDLRNSSNCEIDDLQHQITVANRDLERCENENSAFRETILDLKVCGRMLMDEAHQCVACRVRSTNWRTTRLRCLCSWKS